MAKTSFRCVRSYQTPYPDSLPFKKGEVVAVGEEYLGDDDWQNWIRCRGSDGREAWIPKQYLDIKGKVGNLRQDFDARELSVQPGEELSIFEIVNGFGMAENSQGQKGWVPMNHLVKSQ